MKVINHIFLAAFLMSTVRSAAQTCADEVIKFRETFGSGTGNAPLAAGRTNYNYNGTGSLTDGDYKLNMSSQGKPEWHNGPDHTGDLNGRMMVTNASFAPGEFYRDTVYGLSSTSTYAVYFHAMNVNTVGTCSPNPILPRLQLIVESYNSDGTFTELSSMVSADLPQTSSPTWVKISGTIYLPMSVTAVRYRILNNATGGCGNDVAIDDITFSQCAPSTLPVSFVLKGNRENNSVVLKWTDKSERTVSKYNIEKSADGKDWSYVKSIPVAANTRSYSAADNNSSAGQSYYRIVSVKSDESKTYSNTILVNSNNGQLNLSAYPNPFAGDITLNLGLTENKPGSSIRVYDINGRLLTTVAWNLKQGNNSMQLNSSSLKPGMYLVNVTDKAGAVISNKHIVKK